MDACRFDINIDFKYFELNKRSDYYRNYYHY